MKAPYHKAHDPQAQKEGWLRQRDMTTTPQRRERNGGKWGTGSSSGRCYRRVVVVGGCRQSVAPAILRHRIILTFEAEAEGVELDAVVRRILEYVPVP